MGWEMRNGQRYYYDAERVNGRVVKRYLGAGIAAAVAVNAAQLRAELREQERVQAAAERRELLAELDMLDGPVAMLDGYVEALAQAALVHAGYRRHRGQWRRARG